MKEYVGVISELGASNSISNGYGSNGLTTYSYVQIGDQIVKKVKAFTGIRSKLEAALQQGESITLYFHGKFLIGIRMADGKLFATEGDGMVSMILVFVGSLILGVPLSALLIGIPILVLAWFALGRIRVMLAARGLPGAIRI